LSRLEALEYDSTISSEQKTRLIESARMEITQLAEVISSISQFAMLESDIERQFAETSLDSVLEQAIDAFEFEAGKKGVELDLRIRPNLGLVRIERSLIRRAIENLISNALRFTPEGGLISVCAERFGNEAQIRVLDSGTGIPSEELPRIFEFAFQGRAQSRPARIGSLGLGLALVRRVAELHHGKVTARNLEPEGTEFVLSLPSWTKGE
jgi:signal transduction histidine kinase